MTPNTSMASPKITAYIWSQPLQHAADELPSNLGRSTVVHDLVRALGLLAEPRLGAAWASESTTEPACDWPPAGSIGDWSAASSHLCPPLARVIAPNPEMGTKQALTTYHDEAYVGGSWTASTCMRPDTHGQDYLMRSWPSSEHADSDGEGEGDDDDRDDSDATSSPPVKRRRHDHGLEHDCAPFPEMARYATAVAAATVTACRLVASGEAHVAINWDGGRHHALRNRASGFCYVADVVLGIMRLAKEGKGKGGRPPRVMYLDLDFHYGDGVAQAFRSPRQYTAETLKAKRPPRPPQVLTLSIHHHSPTFFPSHSAGVDLPDADTPHPFTLSIPLAAYPGPNTYARVWHNVQAVKEAFDPDYIVLQLGVDGLPGDRVGQYGAWSVEDEGGLAWCVEQVKDWGLPICALGGGGYDTPNAARAWAVATSVLVGLSVKCRSFKLGRRLPADTRVPDHPHFPLYAPSFSLEVPPSHVPDENTDESLQVIADTYRTIASRISEIMAASK